MSRWKFTRGQAIDLQDWAIEESGAKEYLKTSPELPKSDNIKPGLYVSYEIDLTELDGGMDWPDIGIAYIYAILKNGKKNILEKFEHIILKLSGSIQLIRWTYNPPKNGGKI